MELPIILVVLVIVALAAILLAARAKRRQGGVIATGTGALTDGDAPSPTAAATREALR